MAARGSIRSLDVGTVGEGGCKSEVDLADDLVKVSKYEGSTCENADGRERRSHWWTYDTTYECRFEPEVDVLNSCDIGPWSWCGECSRSFGGQQSQWGALDKLRMRGCAGGHGEDNAPGIRVLHLPTSSPMPANSIVSGSSLNELRYLQAAS